MNSKSSDTDLLKKYGSPGKKKAANKAKDSKKREKKPLWLMLTHVPKIN